MHREKPAAGYHTPVAYGALLLIQTGAASVLFWSIFPLFQKLVTRSGQPQHLEVSMVIVVGAATIIMQACYWCRYRNVSIWTPLHNIVVGHVLMFASRASFFFGGALFSAIFFRHVPQLDVLPAPGQGIIKALGVMAVLFALFCYSLELERLGRAIEESAEAGGANR